MFDHEYDHAHIERSEENNEPFQQIGLHFLQFSPYLCDICLGGKVFFLPLKSVLNDQFNLLHECPRILLVLEMAIQDLVNGERLSS